MGDGVGVRGGGSVSGSGRVTIVVAAVSRWWQCGVDGSGVAARQPTTVVLVMVTLPLLLQLPVCANASVGWMPLVLVQMHVHVVWWMMMVLVPLPVDG